MSLECVRGVPGLVLLASVHCSWHIKQFAQQVRIQAIYPQEHELIQT